jgi:hypothetical protein
MGWTENGAFIRSKTRGIARQSTGFCWWCCELLDIGAQRWCIGHVPAPSPYYRPQLPPAAEKRSPHLGNRLCPAQEIKSSLTSADTPCSRPLSACLTRTTALLHSFNLRDRLLEPSFQRVHVRLRLTPSSHSLRDEARP